MSKYTPLKTFLQYSKNAEEILTYQQLEKILGFPLPNSASIHREWWANEVNKNTRHTHCKEWLNAGWKVETVSLGYSVTFSRTASR